MKQNPVDKEQLAITISDKLGKYSGVSYHSIAEMAANSGKKELAIKVCIKHQYPNVNYHKVYNSSTYFVNQTHYLMWITHEQFLLFLPLTQMNLRLIVGKYTKI